MGISAFGFKYFILVFAGVLHLFARCCCAPAKQNLFVLSIGYYTGKIQQLHSFIFVGVVVVQLFRKQIGVIVAYW